MIITLKLVFIQTTHDKGTKSLKNLAESTHILISDKFKAIISLTYSYVKLATFLDLYKPAANNAVTSLKIFQKELLH